MHGTLDTFSVVEVLQMLGRVRRSGTLHIECAERLIDVHFVHGRIAETRDSTRVYADTVLGSLLVKRSLVTEDQLDEALRQQEGDPKPIGTILVERGFVAEAELRDVLSRQVANTFLAVKTTGANGTFMFVIDDVARPVDYITIETQSVLIEVSSVGGDYVAAFDTLGEVGTVLVRNRDYETLPRHSIPLGRDEFHVLGLIDDHSTVSEIVAASHLEEVTVISILGKFRQAQVLLARGGPAQPTDADEGLQAHRDLVRAEVERLAGQAAEADAAAAAAAAADTALLDGLFAGRAEPAPELHDTVVPADDIDAGEEERAALLDELLREPEPDEPLQPLEPLRPSSADAAGIGHAPSEPAPASAPEPAPASEPEPAAEPAPASEPEPAAASEPEPAAAPAPVPPSGSDPVPAHGPSSDTQAGAALAPPATPEPLPVAPGQPASEESASASTRREQAASEESAPAPDGPERPTPDVPATPPALAELGPDGSGLDLLLGEPAGAPTTVHEPDEAASSRASSDDRAAASGAAPGPAPDVDPARDERTAPPAATPPDAPAPPAEEKQPPGDWSW